MPQEMGHTGYIPSPSDSHNYVLESVQPVKKLPPFYKTDISALPVLMQGKQPSCVAHAVTWYTMYLIWKKTGKVVKLSSRFLYALCKANDGIPDQEGTYYSTALKMAQKYGICEDSFFSNDVNMDKQIYKDASLISPQAYANALQYKIGHYFQVTDVSYNGINNSIYQNALVMIGMRIGPQWWERQDGTISWSADDILPLRPASPVVSGHAVVLYSFGLFQHLMNSWSVMWGYFGKGWYGKNDLPYIYEAWVIADLPKPVVVNPVPQDVAQPSSIEVGWITRLLKWLGVL